MSKLSISLKLGTPKNRKLSPHKNSQFLSLDINGRSYSPQNMQENLYDMDIELKDQSPRFDYESRKFKVRSPSNFIKTAQYWKNLPYQRIRNVQKAIQISKKKQTLAMSDRGTTILPQFERFSPSTSPKTTQKRNRIEDQIKINNNTQRKRLKQIQQIIVKSRQQNKQQHNIIKFEQKRIKYFQSKQFINNQIISNNNNFNSSDNKNNNNNKSFVMQRLIFQSNKRQNNENNNKNKKRQQIQMKNKSTLYAYMVKNRRKLSERRHNKKKSIDYSLLGRINYLQQQQQQESFILRNSLQRVKFDEQLQKKQD